MFNEYLLSAKNNNIPVSLYTDNKDTEKYSFGFIQRVSDDWVLLASISPFGFYDGFVIKKHENVYRCESKDKYGERIYQLYQLRKQKHSIVDVVSNNLLLDLIQYAQKNQFVVSFKLCDSECDDIQGFIADIQDGLITIEQLDDDGNTNGESIISFEDVTCLACDSDNEMTIKLLADNL
jgi:hypothetical protein